MTCLKCQHGVAKRFGTYGRRRIQRYRCKSCKATFSPPQRKPLERHTIEISKAVQIWLPALARPPPPINTPLAHYRTFQAVGVPARVVL